MTATAVVGVVMLAASIAHAEGQLACVVEDRALSLALNAPVATGMGDALIDVTGSVAVKFAGTPRELGRLDLARRSVAQYWFQRPDLRLFIVEEKADGAKSLSASIWLDLQQVRTDPATYRGRYRLQSRHRDGHTTGVGIVQEASGYAECSASDKNL